MFVKDISFPQVLRFRARLELAKLESLLVYHSEGRLLNGTMILSITTFVMLSVIMLNVTYKPFMLSVVVFPKLKSV